MQSPQTQSKPKTTLTGQGSVLARVLVPSITVDPLTQFNRRQPILTEAVAMADASTLCTDTAQADPSPNCERLSRDGAPFRFHSTT